MRPAPGLKTRPTYAVFRVVNSSELRSRWGIRMRRGVAGVAIATTATLMVISCVGALGASGLLAAPSVWDGVYTEEQASRGRTVYDKECAGCHLDTLQGDGLAPGLVADSFT